MKKNYIVYAFIAAIITLALTVGCSNDNDSDSIGNYSYAGSVADSIDMGTSVEWASHNLGATAEGDSGVYASWTGASSILSKYWGKGWRLPTEAEVKELFDNCTVTWDTIMNSQNSTITGYQFTASNGNVLFLPASGVSLSGSDSLTNVSTYGYYWLSEKHESFLNAAYSFAFSQDNSDIYGITCTNVSVGLNVRPVRGE
jgi:uncharacterized protein (TIGR02145 family)